MSLKIDLTKQSARQQFTATDLSGLLGGGQPLAPQPDSGRIVMLSVHRLHSFHQHTYKVTEDAELQALVCSIQENGVLEPLQVRPYQGDYEIISGHRRTLAATKAGLAELPCMINEMDEDTAIIHMVEANRYREKKLPSEKAFSYRLAAEAVNRQGRRTDLYGANDAVCTPTLAEITGESERNARNWIRLTELIKPLLKLVDKGLLPVRAGVELSFLIADKQWMVCEHLQEGGKPLTVAQATSIKEMRLTLTSELLQHLLGGAKQDKPPATPSIKLKRPELQRIREYIPPGRWDNDPCDYIINALEYYSDHYNE